jgi:hypothetical protein
MKNNPSEILIPKAAIRTMEKDLGGIVFEEWEETLAESEISDILKNLKEKPQEKNVVTPSAIEIEEQKKIDQEKQSAIDLEKKRESERKEAERKEVEKIRLAKLVEQQKDQETVLKIRQQAVEVEAIVQNSLKKENEKYDEQEEIKKYVVAEEQQEEALKIKKKEVEESLAKIPEMKKPLDETKSFLFKERDRVQQLIDPIAESERKIEANIALVVKIEDGSAIPLEKRRAEKERQMLESEREKVERNRWEYEKELFAVEEQLKDLELKYQDMAGREAKLLQQQKEITDNLSKTDKKRERKQKENAIDKLIEEKNALSKERDVVSIKKKEFEEKLAEVVADEKKVEKEEEYLKHEEEVAKGLERQKIETERQRLEGQRTELEQQRWRIEDDKRKITLEESRLNIRYKNLLEKENLLREEIDEINKILGIVPKDQPKPIASRMEVPNREASAELKQREGEYVKKYGPAMDGETTGLTESGLEDEETKLAKEALRRLEEKREKEALLKKLDDQNKTREMKRDELIIDRLKAGQGTTPFPGTEPDQEETANQTSMMYQEKPAKPWLKFAIIGMVALILIALIIFAISKIKKPAVVDNNDDNIIPVNNSTTTPIQGGTTIEPTMWASLIPNILGPNTYIISQNSEIPVSLGKIYSESTTEGRFTRIIFENKAFNKYVTLNDFLDGVSLPVVSGLNDAVDNQFTLYIYKSQGKQSLGWVAKRKTENNKDLSQMMDSWEGELGTNAISLGYVLKYNKPGPCTFKSQQYQTNTLRYCDLVSTPGCYGACYAVTKDYLIYGTCCSAVSALITALNQ